MKIHLGQRRYTVRLGPTKGRSPPKIAFCVGYQVSGFHH